MLRKGITQHNIQSNRDKRNYCRISLTQIFTILLLYIGRYTNNITITNAVMFSSLVWKNILVNTIDLKLPNMMIIDTSMVKNEDITGEN